MTEAEIVLANQSETTRHSENCALSAPVSALPLAIVPAEAQGLLKRMFADPYLLEKPERANLVLQMKMCVAANPEVAELRVMLGMAQCVNFEVPDAIEELREAVRLSPSSFIAHLKMGELWMRLRVMDKAEEHTRRAGQLAANMAQSELSRRQASSIRTMKQSGVERGGYKSPWTAVMRVARKLKPRTSESLAALDAR